MDVIGFGKPSALFVVTGTESRWKFLAVLSSVMTVTDFKVCES
jgi:hypothetical protein